MDPRRSSSRTSRNRDYYVAMVENRYFGNLDGGDLGAVLDCFAEDAVFTVHTSGLRRSGRDSGIREMFSGFLEDESRRVMHGGFLHVVDAESERCATRLQVVRDYEDGSRQELENCNVFEFEDGKFKRVSVWMSDETLLA